VGLGRPAPLRESSAFSSKVGTPSLVAVVNSVITAPPRECPVAQCTPSVRYLCFGHPDVRLMFRLHPGGPQGVWGVSRKRGGAHPAPAGSGGSSDEGEGDDEDGDGDRDLPVLAAGCFVGATRTKQVLHQARRAASLVELLAQWKDGGWMDWGRPLWSLHPQQRW
jgi:hypothetical protein